MTPEEKSKLVKGSLDASRATCLLLADPTVPRDAELESRCSVAIMGCSKLSIKEEIRNVGKENK